MTAAAGQMTPKLVSALEDIARWRQESDTDADDVDSNHSDRNYNAQLNTEDLLKTSNRGKNGSNDVPVRPKRKCRHSASRIGLHDKDESSGSMRAKLAMTTTTISKHGMVTVMAA